MINKKGSAMLAILFAVIYFMVGMVIYQFLKPDIALMRNADNMNCASPSTEGDKFVCLILDGTIIMVILAILSGTGGIITSKIT